MVATQQVSTPVAIIPMAIDRLDCLSTLATTVEMTPSAVPFWHGETYKPLVVKLIPRFLYADKPDENAGQTFGHRYGLLMPTDDTTSYNLSQLVEAYVNFGTWGVLIVMFCIGLFYNLGQALFLHPSMGMGSLVGGAYVISSWLNIESNTSLILGGLPLSLLFLGCINMLVVHLERGREWRSML
jgi:hypothetical protein